MTQAIDPTAKKAYDQAYAASGYVNDVLGGDDVSGVIFQAMLDQCVNDGQTSLLSRYQNTITDALNNVLIGSEDAATGTEDVAFAMAPGEFRAVDQIVRGGMQIAQHIERKEERIQSNIDDRAERRVDGAWDGGDPADFEGEAGDERGSWEDDLFKVETGGEEFWPIVVEASEAAVAAEIAIDVIEALGEL